MATNMTERGWQAVLGAQFIEKLRTANKQHQRRATTKNRAESKKLLVIQGDNLFVWHPVDQCLLTVKLKTTENDQCVQALLPVNPPLFDVDCLVPNRIGNLVAICGLKGITILEFPRRWGKHDRFEDGKKRILCRSWSLAERLLVCNNRIILAKAAWHPGSSSDSHLMVLSSDNYIRIYEVTEPDTPKQVFNLNQYQQSFYLSSSSHTSFASSLGETAVSFDFGPPIPQVLNISETSAPDEQTKEYIWPVYILKGNGDVYLINTTLTGRHRPWKIVGPLTMHPPSEDNYGVDACSILCIHASVPVLVIANCSGILYHCVVLNQSGNPQDDELEPWNSQDEIALYVYESVEIALSLTPTDDDDDMFVCPLRLHKDPTTNMSYHCSHSGGVHSVTLPLVKQLELYAKEERDVEIDSIIHGQECIVEHLLCTRLLPNEEAAPIYGLAVLPTHFGLSMLCLLSSWEIVVLRWAPSLPSRDLFALKDGDEALAVTSSYAGNGTNTFERYIRQQIQHTNTAPLLKSLHSGADEPSSQQLLQLLCCTTHLLREEYLQKFDSIHATIECRVKALQEQKVQQLRDLQHFLLEKQQLTATAERLAEKYEDAEAFQQELVMRIENVLKKLQRRVPILSEAEISMKSELEALQDKLKVFENALEQIAVKRKYQEKMVAGFLDEHADDAYYGRQEASEPICSLSDSQQRLLRDMLRKQGNSIGLLVKQLNSLKKELGL